MTKSETSLLSMVKRALPGSFIDARLAVDPEDAIVYRTRQPLIHDLQEVPMLQEFGAFRVSAIMSGRTQVGICVRFHGDKTIAEAVRGDHAYFRLKKLGDKALGTPSTAMKTNDFLVFEFTSRGALLLKKLNKGRGYGNS